MQHQALRTALVISLVVATFIACGCAPALFPTTTNYTTVSVDPKHDTDKAQKQYQAAVKILNKYLSGERSEAQLTKAESLLQAAMAADVRFGPAHNALGMVYFFQNKLYLAAWEFQYASKLMPDRYEPLNNIGLVFEIAGKYQQAAEFYRQARDKDSKQPDVIANLARAEIRGGNTVEQEWTVLQDVVATNPQCEWRDWASDLMGVHPLNSAPINTHILPEPLPLPPPGEQKKSPAKSSEPEDLPLPADSPTAAQSDVKFEGQAPALIPATRLLPLVPSESSAKDVTKP